MISPFQPYEIEIKTKITKETVIQNLKQRASFEDDNFRINSKIFSFYSGSRVAGSIRINGETTTVLLGIYASARLKAVAFLWLFAGTAISLGLLVDFVIVEKDFDFRVLKIIASSILGLILFWFVSYIIFALAFRFSSYLQGESIKELISS